MLKHLSFTTALTLGLLLIACEKLIDKKWDNPRDPDGVNWESPTVKAMEDARVSVNDSVTLSASGQVGEKSDRTIEKYYWALDGKSFLDSTDTGSNKHAFSDTGTHIILVKVRDSEGIFSEEDQIQVTVVNNLPEVKISAPGGGVALGEEVTIEAEGSDANGKVEKYYWTLDGNTFLDSTDDGTIQHTFSDSGVHTILVKVRNEDGLFSQNAAVNYTVSLSPPSISAMNDTTVPINDDVRLYASGKDTNGTVVMYYWALEGNIFADSTSDSAIVTTFKKADTYTVWVKARDNDGGFSQAAAINVRVLAYPPHVSVIPEMSVSINDTITIAAVGADSDGTVVKYIWAFDGEHFKDTTDAEEINKIFKEEGVYYVLVKARDDDGLYSNVDTTVITAAKNLPSVTAVSRNFRVPINDTITLKADGTAPGGNIAMYYWALDGKSYNDSTSQGEKRTAFSKPDKYTVLVRVRGNDGQMSSHDSISIIVVSPPIFTEIAPKSVDENKELSFTISASDADGDSLAYSMLTPPVSDGRPAFDSSTQTFTWTPTYTDSGNYVAKFEVTDDARFPGLDTLVVNITVNNFNGDSLVVRNLLDDNGLTSVPVDGNICTYKDERIKHLYLDSSMIHGQLTSLPSEIQNLTELRRLNLSYNKLTSLPDEIGNLIHLTSLNIGYNLLSSLPSSIIQNLTELRSLDLSYNKLTSLPAEIGNLVNLTYLNIDENQLSSLPSSIGDLSMLQKLHTGWNKLTSLPSSIGNLTNLIHLSIWENQLSSLPPSIGNLTKLEGMVAYHNDLTSLPTEIGNLKKLTELWLSGNQLSSLPPSIGNLVNLTFLLIPYNQLSSLPASIENLTKLETLSVSGNQLSSLPLSIGHLINLTSLSISDNQLSSLPASIGNLTKLENLRAYNNKLTSLPDEIGNLINLTYLNIDDNQLSNLPSEIVNLTKLTSLYVDDNKLCDLSDTVKTWINTYSKEPGWESSQFCSP